MANSSQSVGEMNRMVVASLGLKDVKVQSAADPESMCHDRGIVVRRKQVADELTRKTAGTG